MRYWLTAAEIVLLNVAEKSSATKLLEYSTSCLAAYIRRAAVTMVRRLTKAASWMAAPLVGERPSCSTRLAMETPRMAKPHTICKASTATRYRCPLLVAIHTWTRRRRRMHAAFQVVVLFCCRVNIAAGDELLKTHVQRRK